MSFVRAILPFLLPVALAAVGGVEKRTTCSDVHVFMARGNGEAYPGRVGAIANTVCNGLPSCDAENIQFDSSQAYCSQASSGVSSGLSQIAAYASSCPNAKIVLAGYSLGAQIVGDILGGGGGSYYDCTESTSSALSASVGSHVAAVLLFGDVLHVANEPYNVGTGAGDNGQYPRSGSSLASLDVYSSRLQSYCLSTDPICALGNDGKSHETYMTVYADQAGAWVQQKLGYAPASGSSSSAAGSSSVSSASTSTSTISASSSVTTITSSSYVTGSLTTSAVVTTITSSAKVSASVTTITSAASISSSSGTSTIGVATSSASANTATFTPFDFSDSATVATTSTYIASSPTSTLIFTGYPSTTGFGSAAATTFATTSASNASATLSTSSSALPSVVTGAAYSNSAKLSLNLVTLIVIKMLAF